MIELYKNARAMVAQAAKIDEVKEIRDRAVAIQAYNRQRQDRTMEAKAFEIRAWAERRLGEELRAQGRKPGQRANDPETDTLRRELQNDQDMGLSQSESAQKHGISQQRVSKLLSTPLEGVATISYADLGISKHLGKQCKQLAGLNLGDFQTALQETLDGILAGRRSVGKDILRAAKEQEEPPPLEPGAYRVIVINPGKEFVDWIDFRRRTKLPVSEHHGAHVFLLTHEGQVWEGLATLEAWGVKKSCIFTIEHRIIRITRMGIRVNSTLVIYGRYGKPERWTTLKDFVTVNEGEAPYEAGPGPVPSSFKSIIERVTVGPRIDLFAPGTGSDGWDHGGPESY